MKRLLFWILALCLVVALGGCATKSQDVSYWSKAKSKRADGEMTVEEKQDLAADILLFTGGVALDCFLWDSGLPDTSGEHAPDWWKNLGE